MELNELLEDIQRKEGSAMDFYSLRSEIIRHLQNTKKGGRTR